VRKVTVYPSDYGLQRMAEEEAAGPQVRAAVVLEQDMVSGGVGGAVGGGVRMRRLGGGGGLCQSLFDKFATFTVLVS
jgi:hypothetical protein